ncbi:phage tail tape measure protein [Natronospora cellulosivora (SeqCode)]
MGMKVGELYAELGLNDAKFNSGLNKARGLLSGGIATAAAAGAVAAGAALTGIAVKGLKEFASFEKGMNEVFTLIPEASAEAKDQMTEDIKDFAKEMGVVTDEAVPALYQAISAGVPEDNVFDFLEIAQKAAVGGVTDLTTAVDGISSVVNAYGDDVIDAGEASDLMFTAVRRGKTTFEELSSSLYNVIPTASSLGVEFGDVTAAIATMTAQGTPTAQATTQIRQAMNELSKEGSQASNMFKELSGQSFAEFIATGGDMQGALEILSEKVGPSVTQAIRELGDETSDLSKIFKETAGSSLEDFLQQGGDLTGALELIKDEAGITGESITDMFGSVEAGNAVLALTGAGAESFKENIEEMRGSAGATEQAYEQMEEGLSRSFDRLRAAANVLFIEIGEKLAPAIGRLADWIQEHSDTIADVIKTTFDVIIGVFSFFTDKVIPPVVQAYEWVKDVISQNSDEINGVWQELFEQFKTIFEQMVELVQAYISAFIKAWEIFGDDIINIVKILWETVIGILQGFYKAIEGYLDMLIGFLTGDWERMSEGFIKIWEGMWQAITSILEGAWNIIKIPLENLARMIANLFSNLARMAIDWGRNIIDGLVQGIRNRVSAAVDAVKNAVSSVADAAKNILGINSPSKVFEGFGKNINEGLVKGIEATERNVQMQVNAMVESLIPKQTAIAGGSGPLTIQMTNQYHVPNKEVAEHANNDLVSKLQQRGIGGSLR